MTPTKEAAIAVLLIIKRDRHREIHGVRDIVPRLPGGDSCLVSLQDEAPTLRREGRGDERPRPTL
jgi:hypothetical protein